MTDNTVLTFTAPDNGDEMISTKLMCRSNTQHEVKIENVSSGVNTKSDWLKSISTTIDMPYTTGDLLLFKGTGGQFGAVITDVPSSSKTITFNFVLCKDNLGNNYSTVRIETLLWMAENLKATRYSDGTSIPLLTDSATWSNSDTPGYCWYNNDTANQNTY